MYLVAVAMVIIVLAVMALLAFRARHKRDRLQAQLRREGFVELIVIMPTLNLRLRVARAGPQPFSAQVVDRFQRHDLPVVIGREEAIELCRELFGKEREEGVRSFLAQSSFFSSGDQECRKGGDA